jgi:serine/threonine protein kinase
MDELKDLLNALRGSDLFLDKLRKGIDRVLPARSKKGLAAVELFPNQGSNTSPHYEINNIDDDTIEWEVTSNGTVRDDPAISALVGATKVAGEVLDGRYELIRYLGLGRTSTMYRALDRQKLNIETPNHYVAIKIVKQHLWTDREWYTAFQKAAIQAQRLIHENIARVYALEQNYDTVYLVTEYISGETLSDKIYRADFTGMPLRDTLYIVRAIEQALTFAHERGVVHYDLYPGNVYLTDQGTVKVTNFAVAQAFRCTAVGVRHPDMLNATPLYYESPEALKHHDPDPRDDVYSLACITYELLTGRHPFDRKLANEAKAGQINPQQPEALSYRQWKALKSALCLDRAKRTPSTTVFLEQFTKPSLSIPSWFSVAIAGIFGVCTSGGIVFILSKYNLIPIKPLEQKGAIIEEHTTHSEGVSDRPAGPTLTRTRDAEQKRYTPGATATEHESSDIAAVEEKDRDAPPGSSALSSLAQTAEHTPATDATAELGQTALQADIDPNGMARQARLIDYLMATAYIQIMMKKLTLPEGDNAFESYQKILDLQPQYEQALDGIKRIKSIYIRWADAAKQRGDWERAEFYLSRALHVSPSDAELNEDLRRVREGKAAAMSEEAEPVEITAPTAAGSKPAAAQTLPAATPERISIDKVKHEIFATGDPAKALIQATVSGKPMRVEVFVETNKQVKSYEMKMSDTLAKEQHANKLLYTKEIPLPYPAEKTKYVLAAYEQDGTVIYSPKGGTQTHIIEPLLRGPAVVINEFMVSNTQTIADPQGDYDDWIELYNRTPKTVDISGYYLSDDKSDPKKWRFPLGTKIGAYNYLLVWADGEAVYTEVGHFGLELHTNFHLSKSGEDVLLVDSDANENKILDDALYERQPSDFSIARLPNGGGDFSVTSAPTPGRKN